ncbi:MAG: helix-turn-helix transcriptional regulator [Spirochaetales bacterium]|nr:helix-turn-helix transcriptional regulator [Spirochaetales bacterium]
MENNYDEILLDKNFPFIYKHKKDKPLPDGVIPNHLHDCLEINRIVSGSAKIFVNGRIISVSAGDILLFSSHELHSWAVSREGAEWKVFMFDKNLVWPDTFNLMEYRYLLPFIYIGVSDIGKLKADQEITDRVRILLKKIDYLFTEKNEGYELEIKANLLLVLSKLYSFFSLQNMISKSYNRNSFLKLYNVQKHIKEHLFEPISLEFAANIAGMQKNYFSSFFKKTMGINFSEYILRLRLFHAIHLIENTNRTTADIIYECGFNNESYFYRIFKKMTGRNPSFYRNISP